MRRIAIPWPLLALTGLSIVVLTVQGLRMAADRSARLLPAQIVATLRLSCDGVFNATTTTLRPASARSVVILDRSCPTRLALVQEFRERDLLRWMEPTPSQPSLSLPLEGLESGIYRIVTVPNTATKAPQEMDAPEEGWPTLARFELTAITPVSNSQ